MGSSLPILQSKKKQIELIDLIDYAQIPIIFIGLSQIKVSPRYKMPINFQVNYKDEGYSSVLSLIKTTMICICRVLSRMIPK